MSPSWFAIATWSVVLSVFLCISFLRLKSKKNNAHGVLPPGPRGLPILGHLLMLGDLPHRKLQTLAKKYGPIMYIRLGLVPTIVVSSPEAAELFLKTHDINFTNRPKVRILDYIPFGYRGLAFEQYGPRWRNLRKLCIIELLSSSKIERMKSMREECVRNAVEWVREAAETHTVVDVSAKVGSLIQDMTFRMIFGSRCDELDFKSSVNEVVRLTGAYNLADYVPFVGALDLQGLRYRMRVASKVVDDFLENILDEYENNAKSQKHHPHKLFIHTLLSLAKPSCAQDEEEIDRATIKALICDMIVGSLESSAATIEWALSELFRHPEIFKQVQSEIENVVTLKRAVNESDLLKLHYLDLVIKESMRLHPVGALLVPHESREDITINGHYIPKKSRIIINFWAIGRDPRVWSSNVEEFYPERFMDTNMDYNGRDIRFIPFGSGRRGCIGIQLGVTIVQLVIAQLIHCFNWERPDGLQPRDLDMSEKIGLTMQRANPLFAIPTFRLSIPKL